MKKFALYSLFVLVLLTLLTPFWVFKDLLFPYVTSKAFYFRIVVELALPFYCYLVAADSKFRPNLKNPLNIFVLAFVVINVVSSLAGVNPARSLWGNFERMGGAFYIAHLALLYFYIQMLGQAGSNLLKRFLQAFILVALAVTFNGLSGWLGGPTLILDPSLPVRVSSTFGNPIYFPSYLIIPMFLAAYFAVQSEQLWKKIYYWLAVVLMLIGVYSSGTRGALVGLFFGLFIAAVVYFALTANHKVKVYGFIGVALFVMLVGAIYANHENFRRGSTLHRLANLRDSNTEARLIQWSMAAEGFKDRPLLGTGPENYYVIFDEYYNPELYKYDPSWFDKPHNFLIEVLVTNGILGFAAYFGMLVLSAYGLWKAFKSELLSLLEACLLFGALLVYQIQNLFVFDTVSSSVAFYTFLGLAAYMWTESKQIEIVPKPDSKRPAGMLANATLVVSALASIYVIYTANMNSMMAAKRVNYGYAYSDVKPEEASKYFQSAFEVPFNLDPRETSNKYADYLNKLVPSGRQDVKPEFVSKELDNALAVQKAITEKVGNDPLLWMRLAGLQMNYAMLHNQSFAEAQESVDRAIEIAPKRAEIQQLRIQLAGYTKDWKIAVITAREIVEINPHNPQWKWQLAMAYFLNGQMELAVRAGDEAVADGFKFTQLQQFAWYAQYYQEKGDYKKLIPLLEQAVALQPNELGLYVDLAKAYAGVGDYNHARALAEQVVLSDPSRKEEIEKFIQSLK